MATLKQKFETLLELQTKIEDLEEKMRQELDKLRRRSTSPTV